MLSAKNNLAPDDKEKIFSRALIAANTKGRNRASDEAINQRY